MKKTSGGLLLRLGAHLEVTDVKKDLNRLIGQQPETLISPRTFEAQWYAGLDASMTLGDTDSPVNPKQGILWSNTATLNVGVQDAEGTFGTVGSELTVYFSPSLSPQVTFAARAGVAHTEGDFPFYYANVLGGRDNLRGHRNERFAGRTSTYQNIELRLGFAQYASYPLPWVSSACSGSSITGASGTMIPPRASGTSGTAAAFGPASSVLLCSPAPSGSRKKTRPLN